ncbi:hypothetical protein FHS25_003715 [Rhizobium laguerreae]|uniref:Uncharacterized protein n=1 Tax=Rhizobium laguerreae TaxID=1076926 RepID=A0ABR6GAE1_9HYPH|nr:hypothetical protein [Rhizobium laguerreae]OOO42930.1 hypothetical protein BS630_30670 [Rhizobium laguerreae]
MKRKYNTCAAPLWPEDVAMIRGLVREYWERRQCERQGAVAEDSAKRLLWWFQSGGTDADSLRGLLKRVNVEDAPATVVMSTDEGE